MKLLCYFLAWLFWAVITAIVTAAFGCDLREGGTIQGASAIWMAFITIRLIKLYLEDETK